MIPAAKVTSGSFTTERKALDPIQNAVANRAVRATSHIAPSSDRKIMGQFLWMLGVLRAMAEEFSSSMAKTSLGRGLGEKPLGRVAPKNENMQQDHITEL